GGCAGRGWSMIPIPSGVRVWLAVGTTGPRRAVGWEPRCEPSGQALPLRRGRQGDGLHVQALDTFTCFLADGRICLTNNAAERVLRGIALGRKAPLNVGALTPTTEQAIGAVFRARDLVDHRPRQAAHGSKTQSQAERQIVPQRRSRRHV